MTMHQAPKALVIDDEALVACLVEDVLSARGYEVTVVNTRSQLEEKLQLDRFALAVSDTDLASFDEMQSWNIDRIVICSGQSEAVLAAEFPNMCHVSKPFSEGDLIAALGLGVEGDEP